MRGTPGGLRESLLQTDKFKFAPYVYVTVFKMRYHNKSFTEKIVPTFAFYFCNHFLNNIACCQNSWWWRVDHLIAINPEYLSLLNSNLQVWNVILFSTESISHIVNLFKSKLKETFKWPISVVLIIRFKKKSSKTIILCVHVVIKWS